MSDKTKKNGAAGRFEDAAEYVLGTGSTRDRQQFEDQLQSDAALRAKVAFWQDGFAGLAETITAVEPSSELLEGVHAAIDGKPQPGTTTIRADAGQWLQLLPGVHKKQLMVDEADGMESFLLRLEPGASIAAHSHTRPEQCLVLEGEVIVGEARFRAGDFHAVPPNIGHLPITSEIGAVLFLHTGIGG